MKFLSLFSGKSKSKTQQCIITDPSPEAVKKIIAVDYPEFAMATIKTLENGHNNYVYLVSLLNEVSYVFRFPQKDSRDFEEEKTFLGLLRGKISVPIPQPQYEGKTYRYMGYARLAGVSLNKALYKTLAPQAAEALAADLARFIHELHASITVEDAKKAGLKKLELKNDTPEALKEILQKAMLVQIQSGQPLALERKLDQKTIDLYLKFIEAHRMEKLANEDERVVHRDLVGDNFLVDPESGRLTGVLDFGNGGYGNRYLDFLSIYRSNKTLGSRVVEAYNKTYSDTISLNLVKLFAIIVEIHHLEKVPENAEHQRALIRLNAWVTEIQATL